MSLALASSTQATYSSTVKRFLNFCMEHGVKPLPADKHTSIYFAVALSQSLSTPTIKQQYAHFTAVRGLRIQLITIYNSTWSCGAHDKLTSFHTCNTSSQHNNPLSPELFSPTPNKSKQVAITSPPPSTIPTNKKKA